MGARRQATGASSRATTAQASGPTRGDRSTPGRRTRSRAKRAATISPAASGTSPDLSQNISLAESNDALTQAASPQMVGRSHATQRRARSREGYFQKRRSRSHCPVAQIFGRAQQPPKGHAVPRRHVDADLLHQQGRRQFERLAQTQTATRQAAAAPRFWSQNQVILENAAASRMAGNAASAHSDDDRRRPDRF